MVTNKKSNNEIKKQSVKEWRKKRT